jgi:hypothetical protein
MLRSSLNPVELANWLSRVKEVISQRSNPDQRSENTFNSLDAFVPVIGT